MNKIVPIERIENRIYLLRGQKVMIDRDLAELYGVPTKRLNEQVRRNRRRFPADFMFQLNWKEADLLRSQNATLGSEHHLKYLPYAFTEQGIAMLSSVLNSSRAIDINVLIMRAFVKLRKTIATHKDLLLLFKKLEGKVGRHDIEIGLLIRAFEKMLKPDPRVTRKIGFQP